MKKIIIALLFCSGVANAQFSVDNQWYVEGGIGMAVPLNATAPSGDSKGSLSLIHAQGSVRYMFNDYWGLQGSLAFDQFQNKSKQTADLKVASLELCYNLGEALDIPSMTREHVGLLLHAGAGVGAFSSHFNSSDAVGVLLVGAKPYFRINNAVSLFADVAYRATVKQDLFFNGIPTQYPNPGKITGNQLGFTFGVAVALDK